MGWGPAPGPGLLYPQERPVTHFTGGWVDPRVGLVKVKQFLYRGF